MFLIEGTKKGEDIDLGLNYISLYQTGFWLELKHQ